MIDLPGEPIATIGLTDRIDPANALHPSNASERLLFGQLYETLVRVDCMGRVRPGLASSWRVDERGVRVWYVTLREDARFSDGAPVTAADVRAGWTRDGAGGELGTHVKRLVQWVDVLDDRTLVIQLSIPRIDAPVVLAHPDLAVAKRVADSPFPLGTRLSRLDVARDAARGVALSELTISRDNLPPLRFLVAPGDPRDLLDAGVDLLLTRDPATLDYAAALPHFRRVPLAWQRTHIFVTPGRSSSLHYRRTHDRRWPTTRFGARRGERKARSGSRPPSAIHGPLLECNRTSPLRGSSTTPMTERHAISPSGSWPWSKPQVPSSTTFLDAILPDRPQRTFQRATGLTGEALANARQLGTDAGYIVSVDSRPLEPCNDLYALVDSVPWLRPGTIVPLVDTRPQAVVRRGRSGMTADFDGALLIGVVNDPRSR